ncbi:MAG: hypothetical protein ACRDT0_18785, partial [Pseudonocardiaceae bacterium]
RVEPSRYEYKGHSIELREREAVRAEGNELSVDGVPIRYGRLPGGQYYLPDYAYDWSDDLVDLTRKFIDYRIRADEIRRGSDVGTGE